MQTHTDSRGVKYAVKTKLNSNRRRHEGKDTVSHTLIRVGARPVDIKRHDCAAKKLAKLTS